MICDEGVTVFSVTPSAFKAIISEHAQSGPRDNLRYVVFVGEALLPFILQPWYATHEENTPLLVNMYGPTELTVYAAYRPMTLADCSLNISPIGQRIPDLRVYVLDKYNQPVPIGAVGELHVGGAGVTRGYLNRPELTAERFIADPFAEQPNTRMYKTGDLIRYLPDGNLVYLGRNDHQVKIRGFRIELGEIEARLHDHPSVVEAVVIATGDEGNKRLVAYVVTQSDDQSDENDNAGHTRLAMTLRSHLVQRLPEYMVPSAFVRMDAFLLNANGKLDRSALPVPSDENVARQGYESPHTGIETSLSLIWEDILDISNVGRHDDFFAIGGHSLLALKMISRVRQSLGFEISIRTIFEAPTITKLAPRLGESGITQEESFHTLLHVKTRGSWAPIFCIHPNLGLSWCFMGLSRHLPLEQPLYGLQARGIYSEGGLPSTLDEMALDYIDQIRRVQSHGPYHLLGYSFGGTVACLMASYLSKQGERTELIALMDTHPIDCTQPLPPGYQDEDQDQEKEALAKLLYGGNGDAISDHAKLFFERALLVSKNNQQLLRTCSLPVINANVVLLRATETPNLDVPLLNPNDWKPFVLGEIESYDIHCTHNDIIQPENLAVIGQILARKLDELHNLDK
ncbi:hypothetical protein B0O80DRAFT_256754 [Mortierella sp. GBAus27b]|nr:hypothetical protein B0O80DRAFT_256754 [Mortierella sp. GBAus27b]